VLAAGVVATGLFAGGLLVLVWCWAVQHLHHCSSYVSVSSKQHLVLLVLSWGPSVGLIDLNCCLFPILLVLRRRERHTAMSRVFTSNFLLHALQEVRWLWSCSCWCDC